MAELIAAGASKVFSETASGAHSDRAQLGRVVAALVVGDVLLVTRLDRLARSTRDLLNVLAAVAERRAAFRSLGDAWADTTTPHGRLMLTVLGGLALIAGALTLIGTQIAFQSATLSTNVVEGFDQLVDYLRNGRGATAIVAYSTRGRPGAAVSTPVAWDELGPKLAPNKFTVLNIGKRLAQLKTDPWAGIGKVRQKLPNFTAK